MGFTLYGMKYDGTSFQSSYTQFSYLIEDIIKNELKMKWFEHIVVDKDDIKELVTKMEKWMETSRSEDFFQNHKHLNREYVQQFVDFLKKCDCFCQEEL